MQPVVGHEPVLEIDLAIDCLRLLPGRKPPYLFQRTPIVALDMLPGARNRQLVEEGEKSRRQSV